MNLREIDRLVAEKVMGWEPEEIEGSVYLSGYVLYKREEPPHIPDYQFKPSTNIQDAWLVVEKFPCLQLTKLAENRYTCRFYLGDTAYAETAPLAICLAALKSVRVEVHTK
jgi:hypothetical protein